jgi:acetyl-CoA carboxylase biotin carboxylase subunit
MSGHAIECRINAEDPWSFAPSPGTITGYNIPGGPGVRVDACVTQDSVVHPYYDSLVAKLIVHDTDRPLAIRRMQRALREFIVEGLKTNIPFHQRALEKGDFVDGRYDTHFVQRLLGIKAA